MKSICFTLIIDHQLLETYQETRAYRSIRNGLYTTLSMASGISTAEMVKVQVRCPTIQDTKRTMGLVVAPRCLEGDLSIFSELCSVLACFFASSNGFPGRSEKRCLKNPQG